MSVKILNNQQKVQLIHFYRNRDMNQKELAKFFNVSERTVNRVLIEVGVATPVARIKGEAYRVMQLLKEYKMDYDSLKYALGTLNAI